MAHATITFNHKGCTFNVDVEADVSHGGSNGHGSDEPAWVEASDVAYTNPDNGQPLSERLIKWIDAHHGQYVHDVLCECD